MEWNPRCIDSKKAEFNCSGLNTGSYFISQDEGMTESPVETKNPKKHFKWKLPEQGTQNIPIVRVKLIVCK